MELCRAIEIFPLVKQHVHASTIAELPNGDLLAAWFQGSGERWADDVAIMGARLRSGEGKWSDPFMMADVPGFPDVNPVLFLDPQERLWLVWYTVIANQWETSLTKYRISENYMMPEGPPECPTLAVHSDIERLWKRRMSGFDLSVGRQDTSTITVILRPVEYPAYAGEQ